jgi:hypothetical protein
MLPPAAGDVDDDTIPLLCDDAPPPVFAPPKSELLLD